MAVGADCAGDGRRRGAADAVQQELHAAHHELHRLPGAVPHHQGAQPPGGARAAGADPRRPVGAGRAAPDDSPRALRRTLRRLFCVKWGTRALATDLVLVVFLCADQHRGGRARVQQLRPQLPGDERRAQHAARRGRTVKCSSDFVWFNVLDEPLDRLDRYF
ncbi:hypothetical protein ON010_g19015 [Phytophthora cinnamomi]|nr:hypothetical protein ON010_g19015 [Phytophthora cinnamomi]